MVVISTVLIGGAMLASTAIAGFVLFYQIRQLNDAVQSSTAIYAADAGIEDVLYCYYFGITAAGQRPEVDCARAGGTRYLDKNGAWNSGNTTYTASLTCYADEARTQVTACDAKDPITNESLVTGFTVNSNGHTSHVDRALEAFIYLK